MNNSSFNTRFSTLCKNISGLSPSLAFTIMEIGALPIEGQAEPFHILLDYFPGSRIIAFETDEALCADLNAKMTRKIQFYPMALGDDEQERTFYETNHPMCCSLYKPNEELLRIYTNLDVALLKSVGTIRTMRLDDFVAQHDIDDVDFIKIDIQGAELDVFKGGVKTLQDVVFIVSEVEFIPLYLDQPLFGDVCGFLAEQDLMFHKFIGLAGRTIKPIVMNNDPNYPSQHMWSDAIYIKNITRLSTLAPDKLLKMGILSFRYGSPDLAFFCFKIYDEKNSTNIAHEVFR